MELIIKGHTWAVPVTARAEAVVCRPQHDSWVPTTFGNISEGFVTKPLFTKVFAFKGRHDEYAYSIPHPYATLVP